MSAAGATGPSGTPLFDAGSHLRATFDALSQAPREAERLGASLAAALGDGAGLRDVTYALILAVVGGGLEWLYWGYAAAPLRAVVAARAADPRHALRLAGTRLALLWAGPLVSAGGTLLAAGSLPWPARTAAVASAATLVIAAARLAAALAVTAASPHHPALRLLPGEPGRSGPTAMLAAWLGGLAAATPLLPVLSGPEAPHLETAGRVALAALLAATVLAVLGLTGRRRPRRPAGGGRLPAHVLGAGIVLIAFAAWLAGAGGIAAALADLGLAAALLLASRRSVLFLWRDHPGEPGVAPHLALSAARFAVVSVAVAAGAVIASASWGLPLAGRVGELAGRLVGIASLGFAAHAGWLILRGSVDRRLGSIAAQDGEHAAGPNGRLLTLLPLLRTTAAVALATCFALSALWMLDIPIAPLLAGAGVFGLALGFGAQALVRDIISGIFYLAEDVFRVGEYIESGSSTKGTVERITLRTVALRHQNGPLHFVPYGSLGTVRNTSRDWVVDKFDLPLPVDTDSERVRKLVKRIGAAMKEDPAIGPLLQEPLKAKLYRIEPGVKTFRCKFQTLPGRQFEIRAEAYRRIEAGLAEAGIAFAGADATMT